jgi:SAM-dependent methyltransferase
MRRFLRAQFGRPSGFWGHVAGTIMACRPSNGERLRWTISLLSLQPQDRVLEIGFGPGIAIQLVSSITTRGLVVGIDHSEVMVKHASRRNARAVRDGKVVLRLGSVADLSSADGRFDKVFTINSIHFWNDPVERLKQLHYLLRPGGLIAVTMQPRSRRATDATAERIGREVLTDLQRAGFSDCRLEIKRTSPVCITCAIGRKH